MSRKRGSSSVVVTQLACIFTNTDIHYDIYSWQPLLGSTELAGPVSAAHMTMRTSAHVTDWILGDSMMTSFKWKHFPRYLPFMRGIHRSPVNSSHKGQWRGALIFSFDLHLNKRLSKPLRRQWIETPSHSLWRHCNDIENTRMTWTLYFNFSSHRNSSVACLINSFRWKSNRRIVHLNTLHVHNRLPWKRTSK